MSGAICAVCTKLVPSADQQDHLDSQHLGPHYFWFDGRKYRTMRPSMTVGEMKVLCDPPRLYQVAEDRHNELIWLCDGVSVDLTREPHFCAIPPATM